MRTYGTLAYDYDENAWLVTCEPQVSIRLKRLFHQLGQNSYGTHRISNTLEAARDLEWFIERYPLDADDDSLLILSEYSKDHRAREQLVHRLVSGEATPGSFDLALPPREYQKLAATMLLKTGRLLLADDVGLGKTVSFITALAREETRPAVVVTLAHLPRQWKAEIERFAPGLNVHVVKKGQPYKVGGNPDVFVINYHKLAGWAETLGEIARSVCFDECQELRHSSSAKWGAARFIAAHAAYRCGLSATPIYNYGGEFFSVLQVLAPGSLGTYEEFFREWCTGYMKPRIKDPRAFGAYLREAGLMLRRTRADVARELPPLSKYHQFVESDLAALDQVGEACAELARLIIKQGESYRGEKMRAAEELSNTLRQATGIAKAPYVAAFVRMLVESGERVVLYGWHREVYSIWLDRLADLKPVMFTGSETPVQKERSKEAFVSGDSQVLIISLRAGAGLDGLQHACKTVVFGELDWSPGVHEQCVGRVYRDGQPYPVMAYFLVSEEGADPVMAEVLGIKRMQIEGVRQVEETLVEKLEVDAGHIRRLAETYLEKRGHRPSL